MRPSSPPARPPETILTSSARPMRSPEMPRSRIRPSVRRSFSISSPARFAASTHAIHSSGSATSSETTPMSLAIPCMRSSSTSVLLSTRKLMLPLNLSSSPAGSPEAGRHLIELREDVPLIRHQDDGPDVRHVADRAGLIHQPAIQLVAIEAHDFADRRAEQKARLIVHVHLQGEVARPLKREKRFAHRVLRADEREHGAPGFVRLRGPLPPGGTLTLRLQCEAQLGRQDRRIRGGEQTHPRRRERLAIDLRLDFAAFGKSRAEEREALDARHARRLRDVAAKRAIADRALLIDGQIPRNAPQLIVDVELERVARGHVDRREQRADEEGDEAEGENRPPPEDPEESSNHLLLLRAGPPSLR